MTQSDQSDSSICYYEAAGGEVIGRQAGVNVIIYAGRSRVSRERLDRDFFIPVHPADVPLQDRRRIADVLRQERLKQPGE